MYRVAGSRLGAMERHRLDAQSLYAAVRFASTSVAARTSGGLFGWLTGRSSQLPPLMFPLEGITVPSPLPDFVEPGKTMTTTLENGVRIASETSADPSAAIGLYMDCGSVYESSETLGASHLLRRMAFKATTNRSHLRIVREVEAIGGKAMASASREQMSYTLSSLKSYMPEMVEVLVDSVRNPAFLDWEVKEQLVKMKAELEDLKPEVLLLEGIHSAGYSGALASPLVAPESAVSTLNAAVLEEFVMENYTAPRIVLAASGVEHDELVSIVEPLVSDLPKPARPEMPKSVYVGGEYKCQADSSKTHIALAFEVPGGWQNDKDAMTLAVLQVLMGGDGASRPVGGPFSRPGRVSYEDDPIQSSAFKRIYNHTGIFGIHTISGSEFVPKAIDLAAKKFIEAATPGQVDQTQLDRAKGLTKMAILEKLESAVAASEDIGRQLLTHGERKPAEYFLKAVDNVTLKDISSFAAKIISSSPLTMASWGDVIHVPSYESVSRKFHAK